MTGDRVARLHGMLVEELQRRGRSEAEPIPVAELWDELIPYAAVRTRLGFELNADYEDTLLRLLAGVGGRVHLEPEEARQELARELEAPYPDVGAFRKFSASRVWVEHEGAVPVPPAGSDAGAPDAGSRVTPAEPIEPTEPTGPASADDRGAVPPAAPGTRDGAEAGTRADGGSGGASGSSGSASSSAGSSSTSAEPLPAEAEGPFVPREGLSCRFCSHALPAGRRVGFCPFCGGDQRTRPCPRCDAVLEPGWRYCIRCGLDLADARPDGTA